MNPNILCIIEDKINTLEESLANYNKFKEFINNHEEFSNITQLIESNDYNNLELVNIMIKGQCPEIYHEVIWILYNMTNSDRLLSMNGMTPTPWANLDYMIFSNEIEQKYELR